MRWFPGKGLSFKHIPHISDRCEVRTLGGSLQKVNISLLNPFHKHLLDLL